jgi:hypothetical protein
MRMLREEVSRFNQYKVVTTIEEGIRILYSL